MNINTKVEKHSFGIKDLSDYTRMNVSSRSFYQNKQSEQRNEILTESQVDIDKKLKQTEVRSRIGMQRLTEGQASKAINNIYKEGREIVFQDILFEMFSKALYLDEAFIAQEATNIRALVKDYAESNGGYAMLTEAYAREKTQLLHDMITVCEATATRVSRRKMAETQQNKSELDLSSLKFSLNEEEEGTYNYEKEKLGIDELADLVKKKVLTVIQDEKARQAKEDEIYRDLEEEAETEGENVKESIQRAIIKSSPVEESTLFNSILRSSYKELLENVSVQDDYDNSEEEDEIEELGTDIDEDSIQESEYNQTSINDLNEMESAPDSEGVDHDSIDLDMDLVLAESITKYTLMELAHTIMLENYTHNTIRKISQKMLN